MSNLVLPAKGDFRLALLGHGFHLCALARKMVDRGFPKPLVVTHPRAEHERDRALLTDPRLHSDVFAVAAELGLHLVELQSVNDPGLIDRIVADQYTAAFSLSCRSIVGVDFIRALGGRVFNLHPSMLPRERGGGTFSWRILGGSNEVSASLHLIDAGVDTGPVLAQRRRDIGIARPIPADFLAATNEIYIELIDGFLDAVERGIPLPFIPQDAAKATYLPRLYTETNGAIDWSWSAGQIERFIRAFSDPYPGAFTFAGERRIAILAAELEPSGAEWHPYAAGRILARLANGCVRVIARDNFLCIQRIAVDGKSLAPAEVLGDTDVLATPLNVLHAARIAVVPVRRMTTPGGPR